MSEYRHIANLKGDTGDKGDPGIGSHGIVSEPTDMDTLRTSDDMGTYTARGSNLLNGPPIFDNALTNVEVVWNATNGVLQRATTSSETWYRNANGNNTFAPWQRSILSETVGRIIASKDAEHPLSDGDLLVLLDTPSYFTDFSGQETGVSPQGWTTQWVEGDYTIDFDQAASNGLVLAHPGYSGLGLRGLSWDLLDGAIEEDMTQEIVFKWRGSELTQPRVVARGTGTEGSETGYFGGVWSADSTSLVGSLDNGSIANLPGVDGATDHTPGDWWISRFRLEPGSRLMVRSWQAGTPEPSEWTYEQPIISDHPFGWTGILAYGSGWTQYDWVGVALDGGRAPVGG